MKNFKKFIFTIVVITIFALIIGCAEVNSPQLLLNNQTIEVTVHTIGNEPYIMVKDMCELFNKEYVYDELANQVIIGEKLIKTKANYVIDGDTFECMIDNKKEKVRLLLVDTPETVHPTKGEQPFGKEASDFTKEFLTGKEIVLKFDRQERDRYGRILSYVYVDDKLFNELLLEKGLAQVKIYKPNDKYADRFKAVERIAKEQKIGIWSIIPTEVKKSNMTQFESPQTQGVVGSKNGNKYHYKTCKFAQNIKPENFIEFKSIKEAVENGYEPCGICKSDNR